jgi:hypothetical protein
MKRRLGFGPQFLSDIGPWQCLACPQTFGSAPIPQIPPHHADVVPVGYPSDLISRFVYSSMRYVASQVSFNRNFKDVLQPGVADCIKARRLNENIPIRR